MRRLILSSAHRLGVNKYGAGKLAPFQKVNNMIWNKPSGSEIETNDDKETIAYCKSLGWTEKEADEKKVTKKKVTKK